MGELKGVGVVGEVLGEVGLVDDLDHAGLGLLGGGRGVIIDEHEIGYGHWLVNICVTKQPDYHRHNLYI